MTTKERSVEEIVEEFAERNDCIMCYGKQEKSLERLRHIIEAERQKRDEAVEAERERVITTIEQRIKDTNKYFCEKARHKCSLCWENDYCSHQIEREALEDFKKALTQPNNPK